MIINIIHGLTSIVLENPIYKFLAGSKYIAFLAVLLATFIISNVLVFVYNKIMSGVVKKTKTKYDDLFVEKTREPLTNIFYLIGFSIAIRTLQINENLESIFIKIIMSVTIFITAVLAARVLGIFIDIWGYRWAKRTASSIDDDLIPLFKKTIRVIVIIIGIVAILSLWGIDITSILAGAGIAGLILGFALQDSLKNIFGGISLILDQSLKVGDKIQLETGELGVIQDVGLRSTQLRTYDHQTIIIPNSQLANVKFYNYVKPDSKQRIKVKFSVSYGSDTDKIKKIILEVIKKHPKIIKDPIPDVIFESMGDFSLNFVARGWVANYEEAYDTQIDLTEQIYKTLNKNKIEIPFPTQIVHLRKE
ncbi:MAG: mechanosensitive ion channel family protein [Candidatus Nanoarchaeia archaeon]|nr:mechanosensitive ion channel family protein [Candidatus Nanoarchaeia archaeon]